MRHARKRDDNEAVIIIALRTVGCSVTQLDGAGVPDLLVGRAGKLWLVEVKMPTNKDGTAHTRTAQGGRGELTAAQVAWHDGWKGPAVCVVHDVDEALEAIGARTKEAA